MAKVPITAIVITKNEGKAIEECLASLEFCHQVVVVDSASSDGTQELARAAGADVVEFEWNGAYPKKKQWAVEHAVVANHWVLLLDADEIVSEALAQEIRAFFHSGKADAYAAGKFRLLYRFAGKWLRHGHSVVKVSLLRKDKCRFPVIDDLRIGGITEVEGHYQPEVRGSVFTFEEPLLHDDPDPVGTWIDRHNRYAEWEASLREDPSARRHVRGARSRQGRLFDRIPMKALLIFLYSYVIRRGFMDGRAGRDYAIGMSWYHWLIELKRRELQRSRAGES